MSTSLHKEHPSGTLGSILLWNAHRLPPLRMDATIEFMADTCSQ
ncbi:MAG: hypothetical protein ACP5NG_01450 [Conexivisphaera sp.]